MTSPLVPTGPRAPRLTARHVIATLLLVSLLEGGYAAILAAAHRSWSAAAWQAALCIAAVAPLLLIVIQAVGLPKLAVRYASRQVMNVLSMSGTIAEAVVPWLGWATLLWAVSGGRWREALPPAAGIAFFSYLIGAAILWRYQPRPRDVQLVRLEVTVPNLPAAFDGYTILHTSDLHANGMLPPRRAQARLAAADGMTPDLVVFTGDLASDSWCIPGAAKALGTLRGRDGSFAVPGNHDNWLARRRMKGELAKHQVRLLRNEHVPITRGGETIYLVGVDNAAYARRDDLTVALDGIGDGAVVILLSHAPEIVNRPESDRAGLILSGHTHGGQVVLPLVGPVHVTSELGRRYASGLFRRGPGWLYITRGLGEVFPPLRVLCPPEMAVITLRPPQ